MKRRSIVTIMGVAMLITTATGAPAKHKPKKPVQESYEATLSPHIGWTDTVTVAIEQFSTSEEIQSLAQIDDTGGPDALARALRKAEKGYFKLAHLDTMPIVMAQSIPMGDVRRLSVVGLAPDSFFGLFAPNLVYSTARYPYTIIQLDLRTDGKGLGMILPYANLKFNKQGEMQIDPLSRGIIQLVFVHATK
jgi:hypothetical protein